jgi:hypothetical protein
VVADVDYRFAAAGPACVLVAIGYEGEVLGQVEADNPAAVHGGYPVVMSEQGRLAVSATEAVNVELWHVDGADRLSDADQWVGLRTLEYLPGQFYVSAADGYADLAVGRPLGWGADEGKAQGGARVWYSAPGAGVILRHEGAGESGLDAASQSAIMRINPASGEAMWAAKTPVESGRLAVEGTLLAELSSGEAPGQVLDTSTGRVVWSFPSGQACSLLPRPGLDSPLELCLEPADRTGPARLRRRRFRRANRLCPGRRQRHGPGSVRRLRDLVDPAGARRGPLHHRHRPDLRRLGRRPPPEKN